MTRDRHSLALIALLLVLAVVLLVTAPRGLFSIDESSYIASVTGLRDGDLAIAASRGLAASPELYAFDAAPRSRPVTTPVTSASPPLFAPIAIGFSVLGVRGLMALQIAAFLACAALVFGFVRRHTRRVDLAWIALATFLVGSFALEYAQAIWPHALAMALVMAAFDLASRIRGGSSPWLAVGAGACVAIAAGVRYQNIAVVATVGAGLVIFAPRGRRRVALLAFCLGAAPCILASSAINHVRHDSWNPVSKGGTYLVIAGEKTTRANVVEQAITSTWSRVVDYTTWPATTAGLVEDATGAIRLDGRFKKALVQSSPWALIPLLAMVLALRRREPISREVRRELVAMGIVVGGTIGMFAVYGYRRHDGWSFNQRYLLEVMPLLASALAIALARVEFSLRALVAAASVVTVAVFTLLQLDDASWRSIVLMRAPIVLAFLAAGVFAVGLRGEHTIIRRRLVGAAVGVALGWAIALQLGDDLPGARARRTWNAERLAAMESMLPEAPSVLLAYWGDKDPFGALPLDRDVLVVDPWIDSGATARVVVDSALASGRRVFVLPMPMDTSSAITAGLRVTRVPGPLRLLEVQR